VIYVPVWFLVVQHVFIPWLVWLCTTECVYSADCVDTIIEIQYICSEHFNCSFYPHSFRGHGDEILDVTFDYTGHHLATASADGTVRVYNSLTQNCLLKLEGHDGEVSKVCFNPQGTLLLTCGTDKTARIWESASGKCLQVLEGHTDEIFSCAFNYEGNTIITGSKDNSCRLWR
jgi:dynein assembly factor with WDR repeat domains 1